MHGGHDSATHGAPESTLKAVLGVASVEEAVILLRDRLRIDHVTFHMPAPSGRPVDAPFVKTTYPPQWIARYVLRGYLGIDPVVREGFSTTRPFTWEELEWDARERAMLEDAFAHGLGDRGYSIPVVDRLSRRSLLTLNASLPADSWSLFIAGNAAEIARIAHIIHEKAVGEIAAAAPQMRPLAPREAECLLWTARGKEAKAIAVILDLSEFTVRSYLRTARQKLECSTLSQAVAKAIRYGLIND